MVHRSEAATAEKRGSVDEDESYVLNIRSRFGVDKTKLGDRGPVIRVIPDYP